VLDLRAAVFAQTNEKKNTTGKEHDP